MSEAEATADLVQLRRLQEILQRSILTGHDEVTSVIEDRAVSATARLAVYSSAYRLRLIEALAANFPCLQRFLGPESFEIMARNYIEASPSNHTSVRWFGDRLPEYLHNTTFSARLPAGASESELRAAEVVVFELAIWEWHIAAAFDAANAAPLSTLALNRIAPDQWPQLRFVLHPSLQRLRLHTNAVMIFQALDEDAVPPAPCLLAQEQSWLIWRQDLAIRFRQGKDDEASTLQAVAEGDTFAAICNLLCRWYNPSEVPSRAASLLKTWVTEGLIVTVRAA